MPICFGKIDKNWPVDCLLDHGPRDLAEVCIRLASASQPAGFRHVVGLLSEESHEGCFKAVKSSVWDDPIGRRDSETIRLV